MVVCPLLPAYARHLYTDRDQFHNAPEQADSWLARSPQSLLGRTLSAVGRPPCAATIRQSCRGPVGWTSRRSIWMLRRCVCGPGIGKGCGSDGCRGHGRSLRLMLDPWGFLVGMVWCGVVVLIQAASPPWTARRPLPGQYGACRGHQRDVSEVSRCCLPPTASIVSLSQRSPAEGIAWGGRKWQGCWADKRATPPDWALPTHNTVIQRVCGAQSVPPTGSYAAIRRLRPSLWVLSRRNDPKRRRLRR